MCYVEPKQHQLMPFGCFQFRRTLNPPLRDSPIPMLHPYKSAYGIGVASKKLSKMAGSSATVAIHSTACVYSR